MAATAEQNGSELTVVERAKLENLEEVISSGLKSFVEVGRSLMEIREGRLYRALHMNFETYCQDRWGLSARYAQMTMAAAKTVNVIEANNCSHSPANESQVRPITRLPEQEQAAAWKEAVATAPEGKVTAAHVEKIVASRLPDTKYACDEEPVEQKESSKAEREAREIRDKFCERLAKVSDGGVYTLQQISAAFDAKDDREALIFIRQCEVSPAVKVHRAYGRKGLGQFSFEKTNCVAGHARIRQLAEQIANDPDSSGRIESAARKILSLLGG